ncbi:MAG: hypothetical protein HQ561_04975 [Desulfobacteraceae bacterium]|nr:hypothetical protein [Desulfobacteraceae bacterium]
MAGHVLVDRALFLFAVKGLESPATPGPVQGVVFGPGCIFAVKVTKFHTGEANRVVPMRLIEG